MNERWLIEKVLAGLETTPRTPPDDRKYLLLEEATRIVDETIDFVGAEGDQREYAYLTGHRKRLARSLSMVPVADRSDAACLDVGCYGYMTRWVQEHLGYTCVEGIEWRPDCKDAIIRRTLGGPSGSFELMSHNFDITTSDWPIDRQYDTVLFLEVLEHINHDPMGVMALINRRMAMGGTLVMSGPNAVSYKVLKELLMGMPPWTYWFFHPDLSHEPRHCFEYTPIVFKVLLQSAGFAEQAFDTIYAYTEPENERDVISIGEWLSFDPERFGETMLASAIKTADEVQIRYPSVIYDPDEYYRVAYPLVSERLGPVLECFRERAQIAEQQTRRIVELEERCSAAVARCERAETDLHATGSVAEEARDQLEATRRDLEQARTELEARTAENHDLQSRVRELLFTCEGYVGQEASARAASVASEERAHALEHESRQVGERADLLESENQGLQSRVRELLRQEALARAASAELEQRAEALEDQVRHARVTAESLAGENHDLKSRVRELLYTCEGYVGQEASARAAFAESEERAQALKAELHENRERAESLASENADLHSQVQKLVSTCEAHDGQQASARAAAAELEQRIRGLEGELQEARSRAGSLASENAGLRANRNELLFMCDVHLKKDTESQLALESAQQECASARQQLEEARAWAESLANEKGELTAKVNELLFACDCYLQRINDPVHCAAVVRETRLRRGLERMKSIARKIPVVRTVLRPVYRNLKRTVKKHV